MNELGVFPLLKPSAAVELTASVYGIDAKMIDPARIKQQQDIMIAGGTQAGKTTASTSAPEGLKTEERKHKTETEKARLVFITPPLSLWLGVLTHCFFPKPNRRLPH